MRKIDAKRGMGEKAAKTINFDKIVLERLEEKAKRENTKVSFIVNSIMRNIVMNDSEYYRELAKIHYIKFQECNYMKEQCEIKKETTEK